MLDDLCDTLCIANKRFDLGIKTAMVTSAEKITPNQARRIKATNTKTTKTQKEKATPSKPVEKPRAKSRFFQV